MSARQWGWVAVALSLGSVAPVGSQTDIERLLEQAKRHEHGVGVAQNLDRALELYCAASARGSHEASYQIGWLYLTGRLGKRDEVLAAAWFQRSAGQFAPARVQLQRLDALDRALAQAAECVPRTALQARALPPRGSMTAPAPVASPPPARAAPRR